MLCEMQSVSSRFELVSLCPFPTTITITPRAPGLDKKKNDKHFHLKNRAYFLYFSGLLWVWSLKERERERESKSLWMHTALTEDLFTSTVSRDLQTFTHNCFCIHTARGWQLTPGQPPKYFSSGRRPQYFLLPGFCPPFILRSSLFSFPCVITT